jgi:hypothetical protein
MNLINIIIMVIFVIILLQLTKDTPSNNVNQQNHVNQRNRGSQGSHVNQRNQGSQGSPPEDIVISNRGDILGVFPIPQTTTLSKNLSPTGPTDLSIITNGSIINNSDIILESRYNHESMNDTRYPTYFRKDNMSGSTIGTTEYMFAEVDNLKSNRAWSDTNVSQYPSYYTTNDTGGLTNPGAFFDQNNKYVDLTSPRSEANMGDVCYTSREGETTCLQNDKLYNVPPSLISDTNNCGFLNSIGLLEFSNNINENKENINNGGYLYDKVQGSVKHNERYSIPIQQESLSCMV